MRDPQRQLRRPTRRTLGLAVALLAVVVDTSAIVAAASATTASKSANIKVGTRGLSRVPMSSQMRGRGSTRRERVKR